MKVKSEFEIGDRVLVFELTKNGTSKARWEGTIQDRRDNIQGLGSIEFLVKQDTGMARWVYESFLRKEVKL